MSDAIFLTGLALRAYHGVTIERARAQKHD
jgi:hypothetical protein